MVRYGMVQHPTLHPSGWRSSSPLAVGLAGGLGGQGGQGGRASSLLAPQVPKYPQNSAEQHLKHPSNTHN